MNLLIDISAHGLGHLAQMAPVLNALKGIVPSLRVTVRSAIPRERLALRITGKFAHVPEARDFGFVMHNAVDINLVASAQRYRDFHSDWPHRVAVEADWLRHHEFDALVSNVAYLPLAAAEVVGIPAVGLSSLNWADMFARYLGHEAGAAKIHSQILAAYNAGKAFLRVTPGLPMADLQRRHDIAPIATVGRRDRSRVANLLSLDQRDRWLLLAMGGMGFRLPVDKWPQVPGVNWLIPGEWQIVREDVRCFDLPGLDFTDLLASVDAVVTKPGYGTFAEATCAGIPILYLERNDWPETPHFAAWLGVHSRSEVMTRERLLAGNFIDDLHRLWSEPAPPAPPANGADQAAQWLATHLVPT